MASAADERHSTPKPAVHRRKSRSNREVSALERAKKAAGNLDVRIGGGVSIVRQFLQAGMVDEMNFALRPRAHGNRGRPPHIRFSPTGTY